MLARFMALVFPRRRFDAVASANLEVLVQQNRRASAELVAAVKTCGFSSTRAVRDLADKLGERNGAEGGGHAS